MSDPAPTPVADLLGGRVAYLLHIGRVKDPEIMVSALEIVTELADACQQLMDTVGAPRDAMQEFIMSRCADVISRAIGPKKAVH